MTGQHASAPPEQRSRLAVLGEALAITLLVVGARAALQPLLGERAPLLLVLAAPILVALRSGAAAALLATAIGAVAAEWLFVPADRRFTSVDELLQLAIFLTLGAAFSWAIGQRRQALIDLQAREQEFRMLFELTPVPTFVIDPGRLDIVRANAAAAAHLGLDAARLPGRPLDEIDATRSIEELRGLVAAMAQRPQRFAAVHRHSRGDLRDVVVHALRTRHRGRDAILAVAPDVTELVQSVQRERQLRDSLELALQAGGMGFWAWDMAAQTSTWSPELFDLLGQPATPDGRVDTALFFRHVHPDDAAALRQDVERAVRDGVDFHAEFRVLHPQRGVRWLAGRGRVLAGAGGQPARMIGLNWDVTPRREREAALARANEELGALTAELEQRVEERTRRLQEANQELEAFAHTVAHDLRAPLRNVQGFADALLEDESERLSTEGRLYLDRLHRGVRRLDLLIVDLLAYSRLARAELSIAEVSLDEAVAAARRDVQQVLDAQHAELRVEPGLPGVRAHRATLVRVLANLLENAAKFHRPGQAPHIELRANQTGGEVELHVEDDGIGIAPEHQARIFEVFERLHGQEAYPGTGIGLAIVRKGVERMGGRVSVNSRSGGGSDFIIRLPAASSSG